MWETATYNRRVATRQQSSGHRLTSESSHDLGNKLVKVPVLWRLLLQVVDTDLVKRLVLSRQLRPWLSTHVNAAGDVRVLDKDVSRQNSVIWLDDSFRYLGGREDGEGGKHTVWVLFANLAKQKRAETRTSTTTERVQQLEALERVRGLYLLTKTVKNGVDKFGTFKSTMVLPLTTHPQCSNPWPSCFQHHFGREQRCLGGRGWPGVPIGQGRRLQAPSPLEPNEGQTFGLRPR